MSGAPLNCIPDIEEYRQALHKRARNLGFLVLFLPLPLLLLWFADIHNGVIGHPRELGFALAFAIVIVMAYGASGRWDSFCGHFLTESNMTRFRNFVEKWNHDPKVISFVHGIQAQNRMPVNEELSRLAKYVAITWEESERAAKLSGKEEDWQKSVAAVTPEQEPKRP